MYGISFAHSQGSVVGNFILFSVILFIVQLCRADFMRAKQEARNGGKWKRFMVVILIVIIAIKNYTVRILKSSIGVNQPKNI